MKGSERFCRNGGGRWGERLATEFSENVPAMRKTKSDFDAVRKIGLTFPGVEESTAYGCPALKLKGKLLACMASHRSAEPASLVVCVSFLDRAALIAEAPEIYYVREHYLNYESV